MDSFDVWAVSAELQVLVGGYINKVYQEGNDVVLRIRKEDQHDLFIKDGKWIFVTRHRDKGGSHPPTYAMTLRKHLGNKRLVSLEQHEFDRIIVMAFSNGYRLIVELFSEGNIILIRDDNTIILPLHFQSWSHRELRPGRQYAFPPPRNNLFTMSYETFSDILQSSDTDVVRTMVMAVNIPGAYSEYLLDQAGIDRHARAAALNPEECRTIYEHLDALLHRFRTADFTPVLLKQDDTYLDVLPFPLVEHLTATVETIDRLNDAIDSYVFSKSPSLAEDAFLVERARLQRQLQQQHQAIQRFQGGMAEKHRAGDAVYANYKQCEKILLQLNEREPGDVPSVRNYTYPIAQIDLSYQGEDITVSLDVRKNVAQNANMCYEAEKKMREKIAGATEALERTQHTLQHPKHPPQSEPKPCHPTKTFWFESFRWCLSSAGNLIVCGRNASQNEKVVKKYLQPRDRYVHADIHGAPSCVVKAGSAVEDAIPITESTLTEACQMGLVYSRAWGQFANGTAYWVNPEQVSKTPQAGESLPTGAFVIRGKRHFYQCQLRLAVGLVSVMGYRKVMGGAPDAVIAHADRWIVMEAGQDDPNHVAAQLADTFNVDIELVQRVMPPGLVRIQEEHL